VAQGGATAATSDTLGLTAAPYNVTARTWLNGCALHGGGLPHSDNPFRHDESKTVPTRSEPSARKTQSRSRSPGAHTTKAGWPARFRPS